MSCVKIGGDDAWSGEGGLDPPDCAGDTRQLRLNATPSLGSPRRLSSRLSPRMLEGSSKEEVGEENAGMG